MNFYKLPLDISKFFSESGGTLEQCSELESIDQYLALILTTRHGEHSFDSLFGTRLWEMDFENIVSRATWEEKFTNYVKEAIEKYEKRLKNVEVKIDVKDVVREETAVQGFSVRKRVDVIILATVISSNKHHGFKHVLYLGPLSRD
ncbi:GPW/gp25 family protein [Bacteroides sp. 224]|uniref:GPW/gp25 family protein n=1 Tax=Bacteroides sp. 224 TaxID=2302936 RepID=UPI0013D0A1EA|nr:GPW/gp25 family protein [Bacteroides sp. 224]NDV64652.1 type VI secretion system baseplate protein TssE [Bacteroides sp. 224]